MKEESVLWGICQRHAQTERADEGNDGLRMRWAGSAAWAGWADSYRKNSKGFNF
jgi:hypothetical protein